MVVITNNGCTKHQSLRTLLCEVEITILHLRSHSSRGPNCSLWQICPVPLTSRDVFRHSSHGFGAPSMKRPSALHPIHPSVSVKKQQVTQEGVQATHHLILSCITHSVWLVWISLTRKFFALCSVAIAFPSTQLPYCRSPHSLTQALCVCAQQHWFVLPVF